MPEHWHRYKVRPVVPCDFIPWVYSMCRHPFSQDCALFNTREREALTFTQTYTARVASSLPVLLSAIRVSPPSEGPAHDGKIIGKEVVNYVYKQVWVTFVSQG
jgi:leukotriene-A4 hydrolase